MGEFPPPLEFFTMIATKIIYLHDHVVNMSKYTIIIYIVPVETCLTLLTLNLRISLPGKPDNKNSLVVSI